MFKKDMSKQRRKKIPIEAYSTLEGTNLKYFDVKVGDGLLADVGERVVSGLCCLHLLTLPIKCKKAPHDSITCANMLPVAFVYRFLSLAALYVIIRVPHRRSTTRSGGKASRSRPRGRAWVSRGARRWGSMLVRGKDCCLHMP
jgi:hypothetical protein